MFFYQRHPVKGVRQTETPTPDSAGCEKLSTLDVKKG
jgi:hypothetical protein